MKIPFKLKFRAEGQSKGRAPEPPASARLEEGTAVLQGEVRPPKRQKVSQPQPRKAEEPAAVVMSEEATEIVDYTDMPWWYVVDQKGKLNLVRSRSMSSISPKLMGYILKVQYSEDEENIMIFRTDNRGVYKDCVLSDVMLQEQMIEPADIRHETKNCLQGNGNLLTVLSSRLPSSESLSRPSSGAETIGAPSAPRPSGGKKAPVKPGKKGKPATKPPSPVASSSSGDQSLGSEGNVPGAVLPAGMVASEQNRMREFIVKNKLISDNSLTLSIKRIHRPPVDPTTGRRPLEVREPHDLHVRNLKTKMRINPLANVVPFIVMVDPQQCLDKGSFTMSKIASYDFYVIGGCHSAEARRQLTLEYPDSPYYKTVQAKIYVGLSKEEVNLLAWDHNNDSEYRKGMSHIEKIHFLHNE